MTCISVIITCHNLERYIGSAIESVLKQDYTDEVEILVVDDQSADASADIIRSYPNVKYLRTDSNVGVLIATVIGIENTTSDFVFFLDGDDLWEPSKLSKSMAAYAHDSFCNLVTHDLTYIDSAGSPIARNSRPEIEMANLSDLAAGDKTRHGILLHTDYVWLGSAFSVHRLKADLAGFCAFVRTLPDSFNTYQDWPLAYWAAAQPSTKAGYISEKLFQYRLHGANHSGDSTSKAKAIRNFRRTLNTMLAISAITERYAVEPTAVKATQEKLNYSQYLDNLYNGMRWLSCKGFAHSFGHIAFGPYSLGKELLRFFGITVLGVDGFINTLNAISRTRWSSR
jgi:glycosyltransferase involved in cell wall biosynthesis